MRRGREVAGRCRHQPLFPAIQGVERGPLLAVGCVPQPQRAVMVKRTNRVAWGLAIVLAPGVVGGVGSLWGRLRPYAVARYCGVGADLHGARLPGAPLAGGHLQGAYLYGADLRGADLRGA